MTRGRGGGRGGGSWREQQAAGLAPQNLWSVQEALHSAFKPYRSRRVEYVVDFFKAALKSSRIRVPAGLPPEPLLGRIFGHLDSQSR